MSLPLVISANKDLTQLQTLWAAQINPVLNQPESSGLILKNVSLILGDNVINHLLGKKLTGWQVIRMHNQYAQIYDKQDSNNMPQLTLVLNASGTVLVDLKVF